MKKISITNGHSFTDVDHALAELEWDAIVYFMDDETREKVHSELAPCTTREFLIRYLELAEEDLIIG